jgi:hypothetical protein
LPSVPIGFNEKEFTMSRTHTAVLALTVLLASSYLGYDNWVEASFDLVTDSVLEATRGTNPSTQIDYTYDCDDVNRDEGQASSSDCGSSPQNTPCVYCTTAHQGDVIYLQLRTNGYNADMSYDCGTKYVGRCIGNACLFKTVVGDCLTGVTDYVLEN